MSETTDIGVLQYRSGRKGIDRSAQSTRVKGGRHSCEVHDCFDDGLSEKTATRFKTTRSVARINRDVDMSDLPDCMETLSDMDRWMALWEWRVGPTPWLWLQARDRIL